MSGKPETPSFIERGVKSANFTMISNDTLRSKLKPDTLGVLCYLLSHIEGWRIQLKQVSEHFGIGRDMMQRIVRDLKEAGHFETVRIKDAKGVITGSYYRLSEVPKPSGGESINRPTHPMGEPSDGSPGSIRRTNREELPSDATTPFGGSSPTIDVGSPQPESPPGAREDSGEDQHEGGGLFGDLPQVDKGAKLFDEAVRAWNLMAGRHPKIVAVKKITPIRRKHFKAKMGKQGIDYWNSILAKIEQSPFLRGENKKSWVVTFDWVVDEDNLIRIDEGQYADKSGKPEPYDLSKDEEWRTWDGKTPKSQEQMRKWYNANPYIPGKSHNS